MRTIVFVAILLVAAATGFVRPLRQKEPRSSKNTDERIVGGEDAYPGQIPFQVSLQDPVELEHVCGGVVMNESVVLSAAHCWEDGEMVVVVAGEWMLGGDDGTEQIINGTFVRHESYISDSYENDIAMILLHWPLVFDTFIQPVTLPDVYEELTGMFQVSGWGQLLPGGFESDILQVVDVEYVSDDDCRQTSYDEEDIVVTMVCAGNVAEGGVGPCAGDYGGPLFQGNILVGIASWQQGCAEVNATGVYTQVSFYIPWLEE